MSIHFHEDLGIFHLQSDRSSYVIELVRGVYPAHAYWGRRIRDNRVLGLLERRGRASFSPTPFREDASFSLDSLPQEYPGYGSGDFRQPAYQVQLANGTTVTEAEYVRHRIYSGKPKLEGLPAVYTEQDDEADTLELELFDRVSGLTIYLSYTVMKAFDAISRSVSFRNDSKENMTLLRAMSASVDMDHSRYDLLHLHGAWARERHVQRRRLSPGMQGIESRRGSSSHNHNPFLALLSEGAGEEFGEVYGFSLVYSGSFSAQVEVDQYDTTRVTMGLNPFDFTWLLEPGQSFQTPEAVMVFSAEGLGGMSRRYHKMYRTRLCRGQFRDATRPVLVNNWEATYFNFNADKIEQIASAGRDLGIELFVLDDGWFGKRNDDTTSLGDWVVDKNKLPDGLEDLVKRVRGLDMQFGLWFEPEMISPDSDLYRQHPDWCLHVEGRRRTEGRQQLILDFSRQEVGDAVADMVRGILRSAPITYVKWDMNRNMTEIGSAALPPERQRETAHRYMLGLYRVMEQLTTEFPHILFESCSGGGGRYDPGMLYYMPQTWTSDNSDAVSRLKIQYGTSLVYPLSSMGAHVSAVPNHQVHRNTSLRTRGHAAMSGNFGYELDLTAFSEQEKEEVREQVKLYKEIRHLVQFGDFYRLRNPFEGNEAAWTIVSEDRSEAVLYYFRILSEANEPIRWLRTMGLDPEGDYKCLEDGNIYGGDRLMNAGLAVPPMHGDFQSFIWRFERV
ncbi:alpha-galactosidase [Paenibacillus lautus]|uniref:alpha-galactosidase n=1 Tax=Paenibacillus TaxID=44249 RepID=UPI0017881333|nr:MULTISPECIES: alpha-galactosidase [Paenibacillus]QOT10072.1 alpha-galactosidase [Paenibacillus sp. JNUCC-32]WFB57911.1 alpha-galactosidase [Paenibacillus sp. BR1-192]GIP07529.1 alpha-galactosidase [Paenibacillus lautus]